MKLNFSRKAQKINNSGFTLIEMLVAVSVFAIVMSVSSSIFININNLQQQTANMGKLQNEGRYVLEKMAKEIRGRELDYSAMASEMDAAGLTKNLIFKKDEFGESYEILFANGTIEIASTDGTRKTAQLNSSDVVVSELKFIILPITDPYPATSDSTEFNQPRVTIFLVIKNGNSVPEKYRRELKLQTTISSKVYK